MAGPTVKVRIMAVTLLAMIMMVEIAIQMLQVMITMVLQVRKCTVLWNP